MVPDVATPRAEFAVTDYDLDATLSSGQVFRWSRDADGWSGIVAGRWVHMARTATGLVARTAGPNADWQWLADYFQTGVRLEDVVRTFPGDEPMRAAVARCAGLRLLRQEPWECLASFICSSSKQIAQIRQIIHHLCERFGEPVPAPAGAHCARAFPAPERIASASERELRACKAGFRAAYLRETARRVADGEIPLERIADWEEGRAREALMRLPGVGRKVADCVLLFAYGFPRAFPVDVWIERVLRRLYFPRRRKLQPAELIRFSREYFGPHAGYAQQYLFHAARNFMPSGADGFRRPARP